MWVFEVIDGDGDFECKDWQILLALFYGDVPTHCSNDVHTAGKTHTKTFVLNIFKRLFLDLTPWMGQIASTAFVG